MTYHVRGITQYEGKIIDLFVNVMDKDGNELHGSYVTRKYLAARISEGAKVYAAVTGNYTKDAEVIVDSNGNLRTMKDGTVKNNLESLVNIEADYTNGNLFLVPSDKSKMFLKRTSD